MRKISKLLTSVLAVSVVVSMACSTQALALQKPTSSPTCYTYSSEEEQPDARFEAAIQKSLKDSGVTKEMNSIEKVKAVHDYLVNETVYDYSNYLSNTIPAVDYTAYGVLVNHLGVCDGYSKAYLLLMSRLGIPTVKVNGNNHSWNMVQLDKKWYHVDATWDDPIMVGEDQQPTGENKLRYDYFLLPDGAIAAETKNHSTWSLGSFLLNGINSSPIANSNDFLSVSWYSLSQEQIHALQIPVIASVKLDTTTTYKGKVGRKYTFLATSNVGEYISAISADKSIVSVSKPVPSEKGFLITIVGAKAGATTITATSASGAAASFPLIISK